MTDYVFVPRELDRLHAEVKRLTRERDEAAAAATAAQAEVQRMYYHEERHLNEIECYRAEVERLKADIETLAREARHWADRYALASTPRGAT